MGERNIIRSLVSVLISPLVTVPCAVEALSGMPQSSDILRV